MRFSISCLVIVLALCISSFGYRLDNYVDVYETDRITLSPPQDPAVHSLPTAPTVPVVPICTKEGYYRDPFNCKKFYYCKHADAVPLGFYCQYTLIFNTVTDTCDYPENVQC